MSVTPITNAITILRFAITAALDPLTTAGVYWQQADQGVALPYVIFQSQDAGGQAEKRIGDHGWSGLVTVKALAGDLPAAEALLAAVAPGMVSLSSAGYGIAAELERPLAIPPLEDVYQAAAIWRVFID